MFFPIVANAHKDKGYFEFKNYLNNETPSQFCVNTLRGFFDENFNHLNSRHHAENAKLESKTSLFNQSLSRYIKEEYNSIDYASRLSRDGSHFVEFLNSGSRNSPNLYVQIGTLS